MKNFSWLAPFILILAVRSSFADQYLIPSGSMEPTIQIGDHVLVNKAAYDLRVPFTHLRILKVSEPRRGEIAVFEDPRNPSINLIKRVIGLPGDTIRVSSGLISVNGHRLETSVTPGRISDLMASGAPSFVYLENGEGIPSHLVQRLPRLAHSEDQVFQVPQGMIFFLGDNRDNSADSRVWGFASRDALLGRASRVIYSVRWDGIVPRPSLERIGLPLYEGT
ncbi:MAG: signal peptidase I [Bdellovibrionota bacterium]